MPQNDAGLLRVELPQRSGGIGISARKAIDVVCGDECHGEIDLCAGEHTVLPCIGETPPCGEPLGPQTRPP
ncbi:unannotated protein [freshwater metagenome]|uniref:Unannotated protein n=1 Tax=freshwater metagenome TaxID=449393 RepID=A0A6J7I8Z1_9ZZZZ